MAPVIPRRRSCNSQYNRRSGFIAIGEMLTVLIVVAGLMLMVNYGMRYMIGTPLDARSAHVRPIFDLSVDVDEKHLWVNRLSENTVQIDSQTGEVQKSLPTRGTVVSAMAHNRDGSMAIVCTTNGDVTLYCDGETEQTVNIPAIETFEAAVSDDCAMALSAISRRHIQGVHWQGTEMREFQFEANCCSEILKFGLNSALNRMFIASTNGIVSFHALETGITDAATLNVGIDCIAFAWSADESLFSSITVDRRVRVYDVLTGQNIQQWTLNIPANFISGTAIMMFSPDQRRIAVTTTHAPTICIWDIATGAATGELRGHNAPVHTFQFSADSDRLYSGSCDGTIRKWSLKTFSQLQIID